MTDERLQALEDWARAWSRAETQAAQRVRDRAEGAGGRGVTEERLAELESWARAWSGCTTAGALNVLGALNVRELVAEVRRLRKELQASALDYLALEGQTWDQPAPVYRYLKAFAVESGAHGRVMWTLQGDTPEPVPNADAVLAAVLAARKARTGAARELIPSGHNVIGTALFESGPIPPFRGILDGITAADVYGVQV